MLNVVVFAEAVSDAEIVCGLADRVFEKIGHIPQPSLPAYRSWLGYDASASFIEKDQITRLFKKLNNGSRRPRYLGYVDGKPQGSYTAFWRQAVELVVVLSKSHPVAGVLIHCDMDATFGQHKDIEQACNPDRHQLQFVLATPDREIEAWLLNGFSPLNSKERKRLGEWKRKLSFDPCTQAERARDTSGDRDPKNIIRALTSDDDDRKRNCWLETDLSTLRERGEKTKLADFLKEVEINFLPLLSN